MDLFASLEDALLDFDFHSKKEKIIQLKNFINSIPHSIILDERVPLFIENSSSYHFCTYCSFTDVPQRKVHTLEGRAHFFHALTHIEYTAIDLALDHAYRFRNLPVSYYADWIEVAWEEALHFEMLIGILSKYGIRYGEFPVHDGLWEAARRTQDLLTRMAVIPRYFEANGLDSNLRIRARMESIKFEDRAISVQALDRILEDEISHVQKGDRWYRYALGDEKKSTEEYFNIIYNIFPGAKRSGKHLNVTARKKAGFSDEEIHYLKNYSGPKQE